MEQASQEEISAAYKKLRLLYHPDKHVDPDLKRLAQEKFTEVQESFNVLGDPEKRLRYDCFGIAGLSTQLATVSQSAESLKREFEKMMAKQKQRELEAKLNVQSEVSVTVGFAKLIDGSSDVLGHRSLSGQWGAFELDPLPFNILQLNVQQSFQQQIGPADFLEFGGIGFSRRGAAGFGKFDFVWRHSFDALSNMICALSVGPHRSACSSSVRLNRQLSPITWAQMSYTLSLIRGLSASLVVKQQLSETLMSLMEWDAGPDSGVSVNLTRSLREGRSSLGGRIRVGRSGLEGSLLGTTRLEDGKLNLRLQTKWDMVHGVEVEPLAMRTVGEHNRFGVSVSVGLTGVSVNVRFHRAGQRLLVPLVLTHVFNPVIALAGLAASFSLFALLVRLVIRPAENRKTTDAEGDSRMASEQNDTRHKARMDAALAEQRLMANAVSRKRFEEEERGGLVIVNASYGYVPRDPAEEVVFDVTVPVQYLVENSKIVLAGNVSKTSLDGFCDPCPGRPKTLVIVYRFKQGMHRCLIADDEPIRLPLREHAMQEPDATPNSARASHS